MAISVTRAGKLIIGDDGYVDATLTNIQIQDKVDSQGKEYTDLEWEFAIKTTKGNSRKMLWTGLNINAEKSYHPVDADGVVSSRGEYNKLTQVLLSVGVITESQLQKDDDIELDLESLIGRAFKFKVVPQKNNPHMSDIDLKTIKFADIGNEPKRSNLTVSKVAN